MIDNIRFPVDLAPLYSSVRNVERVDLVLDVYSTLTRFFNTYVSPIIVSLVSDGSINDYKVGANETDDSIVHNLLSNVFRKVDNESAISQRVLDDLGIGRNELVRALKVVAVTLVEASLLVCVEVLQDEAEEEGLRLDRLLELSAESEVSAPDELPTLLILQAEYQLESIKRIERKY